MAARETSRLGYRPGLDGVRGVAIAAVVGLHAFNRPSGGFFGVDLFFVLSGFLITTLLLEEHDRTGSVSLRRFYERRARRLLPALVVLVAFAIALTFASATIWALSDVNVRYTIDSGLLSLVYVLNIALAAGHFGPFDALAHLWSLSEEEQFYVVWPVILLALLRFVRRRTIPYILGLLLLGAELHLLLVAAHHGYPRVYFGPDTHVVPLLAGCLLAFVPMRFRIPPAVAALGLFVFGVVSFRTIAELHAFVWYEPVVTLAGCAMILGAVAESPFSRVLAWGPLALLGRISYSLYLWHYPLIAFLRWDPALAVLVSLAAAGVSYRFIERPFRHRRTSTTKTTSPAEALGAAPTA